MPTLKNGCISFDDIRLASRGRWLEVLTEILGADALSGKNGPCPGCGGRDRFQFNRTSDAGAFSCRGHERGGGDGFALIQHVLGCDFTRAANLVARALGLSDGEAAHAAVIRPSAPPTVAVDWLQAREKAARLWHEAKPIAATNPAGLYLLRRGLHIPDDAEALRFHSALPYWKQGDDGQPEFIGRLPAILARIQRPDGMGAGLHRIYLEPDGRKFAVDGLPAKKIMKAGDLTGCAVRLGKVDGNSIAIAEGVENAMAFEIASGVPTWAAVSAGMMPSVVIPEAVRMVHIGADPDDIGQRAACALANRLV